MLVFKALHVERYCFNYICRKFPKFCMEKLKVGIFDRAINNRYKFIKVMTVLESDPWIVNNFLDNHKVPNNCEKYANKFSDSKSNH